MENIENNFKSSEEWKMLDAEFSQINMLFDVLNEAMLYSELEIPISKYVHILEIIETHLQKIRTVF